MCKAYASHVVEALKASTIEIPSREVEKAFQITWLNIVCHIHVYITQEKISPLFLLFTFHFHIMLTGDLYIITGINTDTSSR